MEAKYGGLEVSEAKRLRALEEENARLKRRLADTTPHNAGLKVLLPKRRSLFVPTSKTGRSRHVPPGGGGERDRDVAAPGRGDSPVPEPAASFKHLTSVKHRLQAARDAAVLPGLRVHKLRHSAASFTVNSDVDLFAIGKVLGHANVASTARNSLCSAKRCSPRSRRGRFQSAALARPRPRRLCRCGRN